MRLRTCRARPSARIGEGFPGADHRRRIRTRDREAVQQAVLDGIHRLAPLEEKTSVRTRIKRAALDRQRPR